MDQLHDEVRPARIRLAGVEDLGDVGVVHHGQGLALGLETGDHLAGVHARLDDFECHVAADGLALLGHVDHAHAALGDFLQDFVAADDRARLFRGRVEEGRVDLHDGRFQEAADFTLRGEHPLDFFVQCAVLAARLFQIGSAFGRRALFQGGEEYGFRGKGMRP